ncbi:hypothetical protein HDE_06031 [Halotydeus destructor]|nr:hypothetical protein HDE_06031 [Halotydeus destructor]
MDQQQSCNLSRIPANAKTNVIKYLDMWDMMMLLQANYGYLDVITAKLRQSKFFDTLVKKVQQSRKPKRYDSATKDFKMNGKYLYVGISKPVANAWLSAVLPPWTCVDTTALMIGVPATVRTIAAHHVNSMLWAFWQVDFEEVLDKGINKRNERWLVFANKETSELEVLTGL